MVLKVDPEYLNFALPMHSIRQAVKLLQPYRDQFNKLSVKNATKNHVTTTVIELLDAMNDHIAAYSVWKKNALTEMDVDKTREVVKTMWTVATELNEPEPALTEVDPRQLLDLDLIDHDFFNKMTHLWVTLHCTNNQTGNDMPLFVYQRVVVKLMWNVVTLLDAACTAFKLESPINKFYMLGYEINPGVDPSCEKQPDEMVPEFVLNDHVVAFNPEEIAAEKQRQADAAAREAEEQAVEKARAEIQAHGQMILKAYKKHLDMGNLENFKFSDEGLKILEAPESIDQCNSIECLYRLLTVMAESSRCMPGDNSMSDKDKIMGSFMELEKDVSTYKQRFLVNMFPGHLTHNDIFTALGFFETKIKAQYVDTKEFIDGLSDKADAPSTVHLFVE